MLEKTSVAPDDALIENLPSLLVVVPMFVPLIETLTFESGVPSLESVTLPFASWARANEMHITLIAIRNNSLFMFIDLVYTIRHGGYRVCFIPNALVYQSMKNKR